MLSLFSPSTSTLVSTDTACREQRWHRCRQTVTVINDYGAPVLCTTSPSPCGSPSVLVGWLAGNLTHSLVSTPSCNGLQDTKTDQEHHGQTVLALGWRSHAPLDLLPISATECPRPRRKHGGHWRRWEYRRCPGSHSWSITTHTSSFAYSPAPHINLDPVHRPHAPPPRDCTCTDIPDQSCSEA